MTQSAPPPTTTRPKRRAATRSGRALRIIGGAIVVGGIWLALDALLAPWVLRASLESLVQGTIPETTSYMREARTDGLAVRHRAPVAMDDVAPVVACAVIMAEDERFFEKEGAVSWRNQRALAGRLIKGDFSRGGSGIAQQLARNLYLTTAQTPRRKAREYVLAHTLTQRVSKLQLLGIYLNVVEWGRGIWGIEAASQHFVGTSADHLTPTQAIVLASFLPAPRRELQYVTGALASRRQDGIARKLWQGRLLSDAEYAATLDRLREWRRVARSTGDAREAFRAVARLMGPERPSFVASPWDPRAMPFSRLCDPRRRGT